MTTLALDRRGITVPPQLSRQPGLARGLVFRYGSLDRDLVAWTPAGPVFGVLQNNATFKPTAPGYAVDDPGEAAGGLRFPRTADTEGFHPSQPSGFRVSGELIFANDSWGAWSCIATTSDWNTGARTYGGINFRGTGTGGLAIQLAVGVQEAATAREQRPRMLAFAVGRVEVADRRRGRPAPRTLVPD